MANKKKSDEYWFELKKYGWGWGLPTRMEGWITVGVFLLAYIGPAIWLNYRAFDTQDVYIWLYLVWALLCIAVFLKVVSDHAPKPEWRWGGKPSKNKSKKQK